MEYVIPDNLPLKEIMDHRVNNYKENNPDKPLNDIFSNLASNWNTYVDILDEVTNSNKGKGTSLSKYALFELHQFGYIIMPDLEVEKLTKETFFEDYLTFFRAKKRSYTITDKGRKELYKINRNKSLIEEFMKLYKEY